MNEVQVIATVISANPDVNPDIPAMIGASAALTLSGMPFKGPIAAARVGYKDGAYLLNPTAQELEDSALDLVVAGTENAVLMVESEAKILDEDVMLGAVMHGFESMQTAIQVIKELAAEAGKPAWEWAAPEADGELAQAVADQVEAQLGEAYRITDKQERYTRVGELRSAVKESLAGGDEPRWSADDVKDAFSALESRIVRTRVVAGEARIDGRDSRPCGTFSCAPVCCHGLTALRLFTRGETQALVTTTLGTGRDAQIIDALEGDRKEPFMLHYNFPPYCVGETGFMSGPKRREIGHGKLARRGIQAVMPSNEDFPYVIRVVSEVTESNGSSSMASSAAPAWR